MREAPHSSDEGSVVSVERRGQDARGSGKGQGRLFWMQSRNEYVSCLPQARLGANRMRCAYLGLKRIRQVEKASAESRVLKRIMESLTSGIRGTSLTIVTDHGNANLSTEARAFSRNTR